jgi:hypothetical protein
VRSRAGSLQPQGRISAAGSRISAWVLHTDEERRRNLT